MHGRVQPCLARIASCRCLFVPFLPNSLNLVAALWEVARLTVQLFQVFWREVGYFLASVLTSWNVRDLVFGVIHGFGRVLLSQHDLMDS